MANNKTTPKKIIQNRVNGVIKSFESFKVSLKNNRDNITEEEFGKMLEYLAEQVEKQTKDLKAVFAEREKAFKF